MKAIIWLMCLALTVLGCSATQKKASTLRRHITHGGKIAEFEQIITTDGVDEAEAQIIATYYMQANNLVRQWDTRNPRIAANTATEIVVRFLPTNLQAENKLYTYPYIVRVDKINGVVRYFGIER